MMAAKLEWVHSIYPESGDQWVAGKWNIFLWKDGRFIVQSDKAECDSPLCYQLADAKAWCQAQEDAAAPAELPAVGDVWGVPGKPETRRLVGKPRRDCDEGLVRWFDIDDRGLSLPEEWQSWVRESGAVRIDGEGARVKELESDISHAVANAKKYAPDYPWTLNTASEAVWALGEGRNGIIQACDDWAARVAALEAERDELHRSHADLERRAQAAADSHAREVKRLEAELKAMADSSDSQGRLLQLLSKKRDEARAKLAKLQSEHEVVQEERNRLRILRDTNMGAAYVRVGRAVGAAEMREERDKLAAELEEQKERRLYYQNLVYHVCNWVDCEKGLQPGYGVVCGTKDEPSNGLQEALSHMKADRKRLEQERDDLRAKLATEFERCARLMEALRGIENTPPKDCPATVNAWAVRIIADMQKQAREAIQREEEGVKS